jgi:tetratricopeptide (TPR) repeat protein
MLLGAVMGTAHRDFARSEALLGDALALAERIGDRSAMGRLYTWLGRMSLRRDHLDQAGRYLERAQVIYHQEDENGPLPSHLIGTLGSLQFLLGNYDRAEEWFGKKLRWFQSSGISHIGGWAKNCLGMVAHARGDYATALGYFRQALEDDRAVAHLEGLSDALQRISKVAAAQGEPETAARLMGAVANLPFTPGSFEPALEHESYLRCVEDVRASLGEAAFDTAFAAGKSLRLDDAIAEARAYTARG